ncbi:MAG: translocation/assembly module TamB domain-containing protein, partial [Sphingomonadaceae bacterium]
ALPHGCDLEAAVWFEAARADARAAEPLWRGRSVLLWLRPRVRFVLGYGAGVVWRAFGRDVWSEPRGDDRLEVTGLGLDSMWRADLRITGTAEAPRILGTATVVRGEYDFAGRSFRLRRGEVRFQGEQPINPVVAIEATAEVQGLTARITISGQALQPDIAFASTPELPQDEVLSRLLFGSSVTDLSATEALQLAAALAQLQGGGGGLNPLGAIRKATGLDRLRLGASEEGASVMAGKYLSDRIYVEVGTDTRGNALTQVEIALTRALSILSRVETTGRNRVSVRWSKDY